jgi:hypothetical protein
MDQLDIKDIIGSYTSASYFDLLLKIHAVGKLKLRWYDKFDDFNFVISHFLDIHAATSQLSPVCHSMIIQPT